jgi:hypothetical protein
MIHLLFKKAFYLSRNIFFFMICAQILFFSKYLQAQTSSQELLLESAQEYRFTPHISAEAYTRKKGKFSFQRAVGANLNTSMFLSTFTYALTNRLEIGTVPFYYIDKLHNANFNFKYNFWRSEVFLWSAGLSYFESDLDKEGLDPSLQNLDLRVRISAIQILMNYLPKASKFKYGVNLNIVDTLLVGLTGNNDEFTLGSKTEFGLDVSYSAKSSIDITVGMGWLREAGVSALENVKFGLGSSVRWYRPKKLFSSPTAGLHYTPDTGSVGVLLSSSFY